MKRYIAFILPAIFLFACSEAPTDDLSALRSEKDSLTAVQKEVNKRIAEIDNILSSKEEGKDLIQITAIKMESKSFAHYIDLYGNVESSKNIVIYPETAGLIKSILVEEGDEVRAGQLIATLDSDVLRSNLKEVETSLELANTLFEKQKKLWDNKIGSEVQFLEAKNRKEALESTKQTLLSQIEMANITAPFNGIVDEIFPKVGEMASPQMPLARLVNLNDVYIKADVSETYVRTIKQGSEAIVSIPALKLEVKSKVGQVGQYINPNNRTFKVRIELPDSVETEIKPNLLAQLKIKDFEVKDSAITVPNRMIQQTPNGEDYVMLVKKEGGLNVIEKRMIQTGISYQGETLVKGGLNEGDVLVDKGSRNIKDGQEVKIID